MLLCDGGQSRFLETVQVDGFLVSKSLISCRIGLVVIMAGGYHMSHERIFEDYAY